MMLHQNRKGLDAVPTTLVVVVFLLLALGISLVVLNVGSGVLTGGFDSIESLKEITDDIGFGEDENGEDTDEEAPDENGDEDDDEEDEDEDDDEDVEE